MTGQNQPSKPLSKINYTLTQLEYVVALNKYGHFAKAAEACHVTQPTLSMQVQKLEADLGTVIFDRSKKPLLLTDLGKKLIEQIQNILFEAKKLESLIEADQQEGSHGELILSVIPTVAPYLLPRLLPYLENHFPQIQLKITELQTHQIIEALNSDEIDVGILATPTKSPKMLETPLYYEPFSLLCRKDHEYASLKKIKSTALKLDDIWLLEEGHCLRSQVLDFCTPRKNRGLAKKYQFESGNLETLKNLVNLYRGYTLLPQLATDNLGSQSRLIPFEKPIPAREIGLIFRREHYKKDLIQALEKAVLACIPKDLQNILTKDLDVLPI